MASNFQIISQKHRSPKKLWSSRSSWQGLNVLKLSHFCAKLFQRVPKKTALGCGTWMGIHLVLPWRLQEGSKPGRVAGSFSTENFHALRERCVSVALPRLFIQLRPGLYEFQVSQCTTQSLLKSATRISAAPSWSHDNSTENNAFLTEVKKRLAIYIQLFITGPT